MAANFCDPYRDTVEQLVETVHRGFEIFRLYAIIMEIKGVDLQEFIRTRDR